MGEWDTSAKEFTAQASGLYLVQTMAQFTDVVDGYTYWAVINSDNDSTIHTTKAVFSSMAAATGPWPATQVSAHASAVLRLTAGKKIWITVDHNNGNTPASLYWRHYNTYLYITRIS